MKHLALALLLALASCHHGGGSSTTPAPAFTPTAFSVKVSGSGRPVIFIPGLASPGSVWDGTVAHLGGKVQAHVLTLAGFCGQPPIAGTPFLPQVHDQIIQYIAANHLDHPIIIGHSLGGMMSLWLAEDAPGLGGVVDVDGLPFLAAVMDPSMTADKAAIGAKAAHDQMAALTQEQLGAQMKQFMGGMITKPEDVERVAAEAAKSDVATVANAFAELMSKDLRDGLPKIAVPVTIIVAGIPIGHATPEQHRLAWHSQVDAIKGVHVAIVENAKHFVMLDQPDAFYQLIDAALAQK